jgi:hypothetical protein
MHPETSKAQAFGGRPVGDALRNHEVRRPRAECELVDVKRPAYGASFLLGGYQATFRAVDVSHMKRFVVELDNYTYM